MTAMRGKLQKARSQNQKAIERNLMQNIVTRAMCGTGNHTSNDGEFMELEKDPVISSGDWNDYWADVLGEAHGISIRRPDYVIVDERNLLAILIRGYGGKDACSWIYVQGKRIFAQTITPRFIDIGLEINVGNYSSESESGKAHGFGLHGFMYGPVATELSDSCWLHFQRLGPVPMNTDHPWCPVKMHYDSSGEPAAIAHETHSILTNKWGPPPPKSEFIGLNRGNFGMCQDKENPPAVLLQTPRTKRGPKESFDEFRRLFYDCGAEDKTVIWNDNSSLHFDLMQEVCQMDYVQYVEQGTYFGAKEMREKLKGIFEELGDSFRLLAESDDVREHEFLKSLGIKFLNPTGSSSAKPKTKSGTVSSGSASSRTATPVPSQRKRYAESSAASSWGTESNWDSSSRQHKNTKSHHRTREPWHQIQGDLKAWGESTKPWGQSAPAWTAPEAPSDKAPNLENPNGHRDNQDSTNHWPGIQPMSYSDAGRKAVEAWTPAKDSSTPTGVTPSCPPADQNSSPIDSPLIDLTSPRSGCTTTQQTADVQPRFPVQAKTWEGPPCAADFTRTFNFMPKNVPPDNDDGKWTWARCYFLPPNWYLLVQYSTEKVLFIHKDFPQLAIPFQPANVNLAVDWNGKATIPLRSKFEEWKKLNGDIYKRFKGFWYDPEEKKVFLALTNAAAPESKELVRSWCTEFAEDSFLHRGLSIDFIERHAVFKDWPCAPWKSIAGSNQAPRNVVKVAGQRFQTNFSVSNLSIPRSVPESDTIPSGCATPNLNPQLGPDMQEVLKHLDWEHDVEVEHFYYLSSHGGVREFDFLVKIWTDENGTRKRVVRDDAPRDSLLPFTSPFQYTQHGFRVVPDEIWRVYDQPEYSTPFPCTDDSDDDEKIPAVIRPDLPPNRKEIQRRVVRNEKIRHIKGLMAVNAKELSDCISNEDVPQDEKEATLESIQYAQRVLQVKLDSFVDAEDDDMQDINSSDSSISLRESDPMLNMKHELSGAPDFFWKNMDESGILNQPPRRNVTGYFDRIAQNIPLSAKAREILMGLSGKPFQTDGKLLLELRLELNKHIKGLRPLTTRPGPREDSVMGENLHSIILRKSLCARMSLLCQLDPDLLTNVPLEDVQLDKNIHFVEGDAPSGFFVITQECLYQMAKCDFQLQTLANSRRLTQVAQKMKAIPHKTSHCPARAPMAPVPEEMTDATETQSPDPGTPDTDSSAIAVLPGAQAPDYEQREEEVRKEEDRILRLLEESRDFQTPDRSNGDGNGLLILPPLLPVGIYSSLPMTHGEELLKLRQRSSAAVQTSLLRLHETDFRPDQTTMELIGIAAGMKLCEVEEAYDFSNDGDKDAKYIRSVELMNIRTRIESWLSGEQDWLGMRGQPANDLQLPSNHFTPEGMEHLGKKMWVHSSIGNRTPMGLISETPEFNKVTIDEGLDRSESQCRVEEGLAILADTDPLESCKARVFCANCDGLILPHQPWFQCIGCHQGVHAACGRTHQYNCADFQKQKKDSNSGRIRRVRSNDQQALRNDDDASEASSGRTESHGHVSDDPYLDRDVEVDSQSSSSGPGSKTSLSEVD